MEMPVSLLRLVLAGFLVAAPVQAAEVTVFAAASLKTALDEIAVGWQAESGNRAVLSYGGSAALAKQIMEGAPADVFISAAPEWMDAVAEAGLIVPESRVDILGNRLVLIAHGPGVPRSRWMGPPILRGCWRGGGCRWRWSIRCRRGNTGKRR
jgi:molybdate transport system substrate-binding protein